MDGPSRTPHRNPSHAARRLFPLVLGAVLAASGTLAAPVARLLPAPAAQAAGTFADPFFREFAVFTGLNKPVAIRFASDGRAFVAEKGGVLKAFDSITDTTPVTVLDIRSEVNSYWDRGLLGIALDPDFLTGSPFIYLFYVYDAPPGQTAPVWNDVCPSSPSGPGGTADGCPATSKLERIRVDLSTNLMVPGSRTELIHDWCQQFPSHSGGGLAFGPDGQLYLSTGDGASFTISDYGQRGGTIPDPVNPYTEVNPCGDPVTVTSPPDTTPTVDVTTAEGGSLRAQDIRTSGDSVGLDGTLIRIDPTTGIASAGNPLAASADENSRRIVAHGFRNPFRLAFRPGTSEIYLGDVGNQAWEEIEKVVLPGGAATTTTLPNFGWPCYEGPEVSSWQTFNTNMCNALYAQGSGAITTPLYAYSHVAAKTPVGPCWAPDVTGKMGSAVTGLAFYEGPTGGAAAYPSRYTNGLFFVDYTRHCMAFIPAGPGGVPDASQEAEVARNIGGPVDLVTGPGGDLYYVDLDGNRVMRLRYLLAPIARATATPPISNAPVVVRLDASSSTDPDPGFTLDSWAWDLDNDGQYDDASGATYDWSITTATIYPISLKVTSTNGLSDTVDLIVNAANDPPVPVISTPSSSLTWSVGDTIPFSGSATDTQDGAIPAADLE
ncbi:MAG: PQQ-dependent sugar dehydrogenase, partial [Candidatus Limnocylindrales bacterium]